MHATAILQAQARSLWNYYRRGSRVAAVPAVFTLLWYGLWGVAAFVLGSATASPASAPVLRDFLPSGLFGAFLYWQIFPALLLNAGASLDVRRLRLFPVPDSQLFGIDALLRLSTGVEVVILLAGVFTGIGLNPALPKWTLLALPPYFLFNLFFAVGLREVFARLLARRYIREISVLALVSLSALPQVLLVLGVPSWLERATAAVVEFPFPWTSCARWAAGRASVTDAVSALGWTVAAYWFGRWRFRRSLEQDIEAVPAQPAGPRSFGTTGLFRWPSRLFSDPLAAQVEKELRILCRSPRFRLLLFMSVTLGQVMWMPVVLRSEGGVASSNIVLLVSLYALLLIGETFSNCLGYDRGAARLYFLFPRSLAPVLAGKNLAALAVVLVQVTASAVISRWILRLPVPAAKIAEAYAVMLIIAVYLAAMGNLWSVYFPRPVDPAQSWRASGWHQAVLVLLFPVVALPVILSYIALWASDSPSVFYACLAAAAILGGLFYTVALGAATEALSVRKESIVKELSGEQGPVQLM